MCVGEKADLFLLTFDSPEAWEKWLKANHPRILDGWSMDKGDRKQYGTGYYWSMLEKHEEDKSDADAV